MITFTFFSPNDGTSVDGGRRTTYCSIALFLSNISTTEITFTFFLQMMEQVLTVAGALLAAEEEPALQLLHHHVLQKVTNLKFQHCKI